MGPFVGWFVVANHGWFVVASRGVMFGIVLCNARPLLLSLSRKTYAHINTVLIVVMRLPGCPSVELGAWSVRCVGWADWVDCRCQLG